MRYLHEVHYPPALEKAGWDMQRQVREVIGFIDGRIYVKGNLSSRGKRADYILYYKPNIPVAMIEAKDNKQSAIAGIQRVSRMEFTKSGVKAAWIIQDCSTYHSGYSLHCYLLIRGRRCPQ
jgi:hypothetical protein